MLAAAAGAGEAAAPAAAAAADDANADGFACVASAVCSSTAACSNASSSAVQSRAPMPPTCFSPVYGTRGLPFWPLPWALLPLPLLLAVPTAAAAAAAAADALLLFAAEDGAAGAGNRGGAAGIDGDDDDANEAATAVSGEGLPPRPRPASDLDPAAQPAAPEFRLPVAPAASPGETTVESMRSDTFGMREPWLLTASNGDVNDRDAEVPAAPVAAFGWTRPRFIEPTAKLCGTTDGLATGVGTPQRLPWKELHVT